MNGSGILMTTGPNIHLSLDILVMGPNSVPFMARPLHSRFSNKWKEALPTQSQVRWYFLMSDFTRPSVPRDNKVMWPLRD